MFQIWRLRKLTRRTPRWQMTSIDCSRSIPVCEISSGNWRYETRADTDTKRRGHVGMNNNLKGGKRSLRKFPAETRCSCFFLVFFFFLFFLFFFFVYSGFILLILYVWRWRRWKKEIPPKYARPPFPVVGVFIVFWFVSYFSLPVRADGYEFFAGLAGLLLFSFICW